MIPKKSPICVVLFEIHPHTSNLESYNPTHYPIYVVLFYINPHKSNLESYNPKPSTLKGELQFSIRHSEAGDAARTLNPTILNS